MKKGIIAVSLLMAGALFLTPLASTSFAKNDTENIISVEAEERTDKVQSSNEVEKEATQVTEIKEQVKEKQNSSKDEVSKEQNISKKEPNIIKEEIKDEVKSEDSTEVVNEDKGMTKEEAQTILDKYIREVEQGDFTYTYQGDENTFEAIKVKGTRGYVFLPNIETDMAYLVDKDSGNIYFFHPSGYFELLQ